MFFYVFFRQYFELENLRKRHVEELKNCIKTISSEGLQPTILYEALSPLSNSSKSNNIFGILPFIIIKIYLILGKKLAGETSGNSRSTSPILDNEAMKMKFTPTGLYFLPESVKLLSPSLAESQYHDTKH